MLLLVFPLVSATTQLDTQPSSHLLPFKMHTKKETIIKG